MYGYGPPPPYGGYGSYPAAYGTAAPPPPYGASAPPYGTPQTAYGGPPPPYGAPYGAPPGPYGASAPYGAPPPSYGAPQAPYGSAAPPAAQGYRSEMAPAAPQTTQPAQQGQSEQVAQAQSGSAYPSLTAPTPPTVPQVPAGSSSNNNSSDAQKTRPSSAYPSFGGQTVSIFGAPPPETTSRPMSAMPSLTSNAYGSAPQAGAAPYTYGQPPVNPQAPPVAAAAARPAYAPPTTYAPAPGHGGRRRRALLVGCSYQGTNAALNGCLNDIHCIQYCLQNRFGFTEQQMVVLKDDPGRHPDFKSTKANVYKGIHWLLMDQRPGDSLFFHFSGHGSQQYDRNGDEEDGYDETICPSDFRSAGMIVDDELNRLMVRPLMPGVTLHAVVDACHSGTALDLPFRAKVDSGGRWYWKGRPRYDKMTSGGTVFQFGACKDHQVAQDTKALSGHTYTGAATFCFIQAIETHGTQQTYGQVLNHMMTTLRATTGSSGMGSSTSIIASFLLGGSFTGGSGQTPVLSCDKQVDLYATRLSL